MYFAKYNHLRRRECLCLGLGSRPGEARRVEAEYSRREAPHDDGDRAVVGWPRPGVVASTLNPDPCYTCLKRVWVVPVVWATALEYTN